MPCPSSHGILVDAVRSHLVSDVPLGAFLSGGVDSSLVVGLMAETSGGRVKTFSIGFDEPAFDELEHARRVAHHFGTDHHEFVVQAGRDRDPRFADLAFRRTVRRFVGHSDVVRLGEGQRARDGRAVRGRRRRALRRVRSLPAAPAGRRLRSVRPGHGPEGRGDRRGAPATRRTSARISFGTSRATHAVATSMPIRFFSRDEKAALLAPDVVAQLSVVDPEARLARLFEPYAGLPWASQMMRFDARHVLARGRADESGPHEHGAFDRVARAAARQRGGRVCVLAAGRAQDQGRTSQAHPERGRREAAAVARS